MRRMADMPLALILQACEPVAAEVWVVAKPLAVAVAPHAVGETKLAKRMGMSS